MDNLKFMFYGNGKNFSRIFYWEFSFVKGEATLKFYGNWSITKFNRGNWNKI